MWHRGASLVLGCVSAVVLALAMPFTAAAEGIPPCVGASCTDHGHIYTGMTAAETKGQPADVEKDVVETARRSANGCLWSTPFR